MQSQLAFPDVKFIALRARCVARRFRLLRTSRKVTRRGAPEKIRFLNISQGSLEECRYYLILTQDLGYGATADMEALLAEVSKVLLTYANAIESNPTFKF